MKVLIVEDEAASLKLARIVLVSGGHEVSSVEGVEEAVEIVLKGHPDAILLDLELPGLKGLDLARQLKSDPTTQHIAIIAATAFPERYPRQLALDAGCDSYLIKPIDTRTLNREIAQTLDNLM